MLLTSVSALGRSFENLYDKSPRGKLQDNLRCYSLVSRRWVARLVSAVYLGGGGGGLSRSDFRGLVLVRSSASRTIVWQHCGCSTGTRGRDVHPSSARKGAVWSDWNVMSCEFRFLPSDLLRTLF